MRNKINRLEVVVILVVTMLFVASPVFAGGGMVRGEKAQGSATQVQVMDPPPFQP